MEAKVVGITGNLGNIEELKKFARASARVCYTGKDFEDVVKEENPQRLIKSLIESGHHSPFEHTNITFYLSHIPKILAMVLNNEKQYATSEKSARYTQMREVTSEQRELYNKWMEILQPAISDSYPKTEDEKSRKVAVKKLAQENARYMISVFTPTKMVHTVNLRQLNFLRNQFREYIDNVDANKSNSFKERLARSMEEFLMQTKGFEVEGLDNQTDRHLSLFSNDIKTPKELFGDVYSTTYQISFAGLAQEHRHRTIDYKILQGPFNENRLGFFVPGIIQEIHTEKEWESDLESVAAEDYPQGELLLVNERGIRENFRSKMILRMCGHAQWEIMKQTLDTARKYQKDDPDFNYDLSPKCLQGMSCASPCVWGGEKALERIV